MKSSGKIIPSESFCGESPAPSKEKSKLWLTIMMSAFSTKPLPFDNSNVRVAAFPEQTDESALTDSHTDCNGGGDNSCLMPSFRTPGPFKNSIQFLFFLSRINRFSPKEPYSIWLNRDNFPSQLKEHIEIQQME